MNWSTQQHIDIGGLDKIMKELLKELVQVRIGRKIVNKPHNMKVENSVILSICLLPVFIM